MDADETDAGKAGAKPVLPGNNGQFGEGDATEDYKPLENHPAPEPSAPQGPQQTNAGERS